MRAILTSFTLMALCGCGGGTSGGATGSAGSPPAAATLADEISAAERAGRIPTFDRSSILTGVDSDGNGVRDDIDTYIASLPYSAIQKSAVLQRARAFQRTLVIDLSNRTQVQQLADEIMAAVNCLGDVLPLSDRRGLDLEALTMNTRDRAARYMHFNAALSGGVYDLPDGDTCVR